MGPKISIPAVNPQRTEEQGYFFFDKNLYQIVEKVEANHSQKTVFKMLAGEQKSCLRNILLRTDVH